MDQNSLNEVRSLFRLSLQSTEDVAVALAEGGARSPPHIPRIIESILFTRRFLPSYLAVLTSIILTWSLIRWVTTKSDREPGYRTRGPDSSDCTSSSASTLQGTESPPLKSNDTSEDTPLLAEAQVRRAPASSPAKRTWYRVRSFLLRQPKPIPSLTAPRNTLPENETSVLILAFLALNLFYLFYGIQLTADNIFGIADRAGLLFAVNLPVLYILAAKNNQPLGWLTGWSYEGLNIFHRRLGEWLTVSAVIHAIGMVIGFYQLLAPFGYTLGWYLTRKIIIFGLIAFSSYMIIYSTSLGSFRQAFYELFLVSHIFLQAVALVFLFLHHHSARPYVGGAIAIWVLDRGVSRIVCKTQSFIATLEVAADKETVLLYCDIPLQHSRLPKFGMRAGWHAGQHVFLVVPEMGIKHRFQAHPFTIASAQPPRDLVAESWPLQLTIRAQDGFSRDLLRYAEHHQHTRVRMDGPYSSRDVLKAVEASDRVCLVAGGSGIAVTYPFAWARKTPQTSGDRIVHNRARYVDGKKILKPDVVKSGKRIDSYRFGHFWVRQDTRHESWVTMLPSATDTDLLHADSETAIDLITHRFNTRAELGGERPDIKLELEAWVRGGLGEKINMQDPTCVVVSGPDGLVRDIRNAVASLVREGWNIEVHIEKFGW